MNYSLRELECFIAVAEELSFTRAAQRLHLAQPPLSRHVRELEAKVGARLFERTRRSVALTPAGGLFYAETHDVLRHLQRAGEVARRASIGETERLRLGFVSAVLSPELVETFRRFRQRFPSAQIELHDRPPAEQLRAITRGELDGGFVGLMPRDRPAAVQFVPWREEPLACFVPANHALASHRKLDLAAAAGEPFVAVAGAAAPAFADFVRGVCRSAGFRPRIVLESPRAQAVAVMVAAGSGIALLPQSLSQWTGRAVVALPLAKPQQVTHVFARRAGGVSGAMRHFLAHLSEAKADAKRVGK
ncbi:MAG TPA: LysR substrate-binding domain-containing protein [Opitutaceae bacterium]|nr:LysR substrate-binding domain-containing protein [Opitutaceae bacterium]